ncbi:MAG: EAL domain-containing protein [Burkholderiales bacterium]|nr:EAL domain-containing protein [Burkholderiales bacterium]
MNWPRLGLRAKLNLLTIMLIVATAAGIAAYLVRQELRDARANLENEGVAILSLLSEAGELPMYTGNRTQLSQVLGSLSLHRDIAYAVALDAQRTELIRRLFSIKDVPALPNYPIETQIGRIQSTYVTAEGKRILELFAPILGNRGDSGESKTETIGYVRLGLSQEQVEARASAYLTSALLVSGFVVLIGIVLSLLLTRRILAPVRNLTQAAEAVGRGDLRVRVPETRSSEFEVLTDTFNQMTARLAASQASVEDYQHTLEEKVEQRTRELQTATARAYKLAQQDILTGLPNRVLLNQRLQQILALAKREHQQVAVLFLDFDHFKRINDTLGHDTGDQLLQQVAQRLSATIRESDLVARLGGDEFVLVLTGLNMAQSAHELLQLVERVRGAFGTPFIVNGQDLSLTVSIGVSMFPDDAIDAPNLIKQADTAMYAAKEQGRNAYRFFTADMNARIQARLQLENALRRALANQEFYLVYQPQIDMATGLPVGVEALVRWRDPEHGEIQPGEFITIAEESGLIHPIGAWVLETACKQGREWAEQDMLLRISVNVSVRQLEQDTWLEVVRNALKVSRLAPSYLDLEITESVIISNADKAVATLSRLKQMGVTLTMDDFGTGYSSLYYLTRLPLNNIKIDQKFIRGLDHDRNDEAITHAIIALSHGLGMRVIAEGVETPSQFRFLQKQGCEEAQGFYIGRPMTAPALKTWWEQRMEYAMRLRGEGALVNGGEAGDA